MDINKGMFLVLLLMAVNVDATPQIQHWQTEKGIDVYFVEAHELPILDMQIIFDAGSSRDDEHKGLAMLTSGLLDEGAGGLDADQISQYFEKLGAIYSGSAGYDSASISLRTLADKDKLMPAIENLKRVITQPDFPQAAFERQRKRTLVGIRQKQQSPGALASDAFYEAVFTDHPYAYPNEGTEETLQSITREDIKEFYKQYYVARNAMIVMVGDVDRPKAEHLANDLTADLAMGKKAPPLTSVKGLEQKKLVKLEHPSVQTHILVGQPGMKRGDPDYFPLYVGNHVLGGGGMVSRLFEEIREKRGLSYSAYSHFSPMRQNGPFMAGLQTRTDQAGEALDVLMLNLQQFIEQGPTEEELIASKKNITGSFPLQLDSNRDILGYVAMIGYYGLPLDYLDTLTKNVESVTVEQIKDAFRRRLSPDKLVTVMVGPQAEQRGTAD
jgi:zinc protease